MIDTLINLITLILTLYGALCALLAMRISWLMDNKPDLRSLEEDPWFVRYERATLVLAIPVIPLVLTLCIAWIFQQ